MTEIIQISICAENYPSTTEEYQLRFKYLYKLVNGKTTLITWIRIGADRKQRSGSRAENGNKERLKHRTGLATSHN